MSRESYAGTLSGTASTLATLHVRKAAPRGEGEASRLPTFSTFALDNQLAKHPDSAITLLTQVVAPHPTG